MNPNHISNLSALPRLARVRCVSLAIIVSLLLSTAPSFANAQESALRYGRGVPPTVRLINKRALDYLAATQSDDGTWPEQSGPGVGGICVMAFLASGNDPDFGPYAENVRRALQAIIKLQNPKTGHVSGPGHGPMYHHGFATLALSEAYGVVNEERLWRDSQVPPSQQRTVAKALELAVRLTVTAQESNPWGAWRYSPNSQDADTTVSGTVLMGLLGARNAGIRVPNESIDKAISFFETNTMRDGNVMYQPGQNNGNGLTRSAIATLVFAMAKRKDTAHYKSAASYIKRQLDQDANRHPFYHRYYMAQALFHSDLDAWRAWNEKAIRKLQSMQQEDGSFHSAHGAAYGTGMSVLALALNYRLLPVYER